MADDLDDLDAPLQDERPDPARRTWPLALGATVVIVATLMWLAHAFATWWTDEVYCGLVYC